MTSPASPRPTAVTRAASPALNGRIMFDDVRVLRQNLLNRDGQVDEGGAYSSPIDETGRRFFTMLGTARPTVTKPDNIAITNCCGGGCHTSGRFGSGDP